MAIDLAMLRMMVSEPTEDVYSDELLTSMLERHPLVDYRGRKSGDADWVEDYDYNLTASEIWLQKAGALASAIDFNADGGSYSSNQLHKNAMEMASMYASRSGVTTITLHAQRLNTDEDFGEDGSIN